MGGCEPRSYRSRGFGNQFQVVMSWYRRPYAETRRDVIVALRARDQVFIALFGKLRAWIADHALDDFIVAAFDQHVGHRVAQPLSDRNRQQVALTLAACAFH